MGSPVDTILKLSIAAAALIAAGGVGYYYGFYLPQRDAALDLRRNLEAARAEYSRKAEQSRAETEKRSADQKALESREAVQNRYRACIANAELNYNSNWSRGCRSIADSQQKSYNECMKLPNNSSCASIYSERAFSADCSLPRAVATDKNETLERARKRCLDESQAGFQ